MISVTETQPRTSRFQYRGSNGQIVKPYADAGAARGESLPVYVCNRCGRNVVWCTSKKTGRKYLAHVAHHTSDGMTVDSFWYNAAAVHTDEVCQRRQDERNADIARIERQARYASYTIEQFRFAAMIIFAQDQQSASWALDKLQGAES